MLTRRPQEAAAFGADGTRALAYFLCNWHSPAKEPAPGLTRRKVVQGVEEVLLSTLASLKNNPAPQPSLTGLIPLPPQLSKLAPSSSSQPSLPRSNRCPTKNVKGHRQPTSLGKSTL